MKRITTLSITVLFVLILLSVYLVSCNNVSGNSSGISSASSDPSNNARRVFNAQAVAAEYIITDLGALGGASSNAHGINNKGQVVGEAQTDSDSRAFLYGNGSMTDLGTLGGREGRAFDINDSGQVVGWSRTAAGEFHAFLYSNGSMTDLGTLGGGDSTAYGINDSGAVVGTAQTAASLRPAFLYSNGSMTSLGTLGGPEGVARDINNNGQIAGWSMLADGFTPQAFLYSNGAMTGLGTLGGSGSMAFGINDSGQVVGWSQAAAGGVHAFLYSNGSMTSLGTLGGSMSSAYAINTSGQIVGVSEIAPQSDTRHAFLSNKGKMADLNDLIDANSGWTLAGANDINDHGQIVGQGHFNGKDRAFLLTPINFTSTGTSVTVTPKDTTTGTTPVTVTFATVTASGTTTLTTSEQGPPPDEGFKLGNPPVYYDISTTAMYSGPVTVCIDYSGIGFGSENSLSLRHYEDTNGDGIANQWVDRTISNDTVNKIICAEVSSLSFFAILEPALQFTGFFRPVDNPSAVNDANAGQAIPVKWRVTNANGTPVADAASFRQLVSYQVNCDDLAGDAGTSVAESAAANSGLQYKGDGYWQFNWKTPKTYADQCRRMVLTLGDGSMHEAVFQFK